MGSIWLDGRTAGYPNVATVLRNAGVNVQEYAGWQTRSRSSGGMNQFMGILAHHTASNTTPQNDLSYMVNGSPDAPVSNGLLDRDGVFWLIAGGASNHGGKGGGSDSRPPWDTSKGRMPVDASNSNTFGIECANNGVGQAYPEPQQNAYTKMCAALSSAYGLRMPSDLRSHWEWTDRKCDPTGPSRFCDGNRNGCNGACRWNMDIFRAEVASIMGGGPPPTPGRAKEDAMIVWQDIRYLNVFNMNGPTHMDGYLMGALQYLKAEGHHYAKGYHDQTLAGLCRLVFGITGANDQDVIAKAEAAGMLARNGNYDNDLKAINQSNAAGKGGLVW
jgi:hypothetical protein